MKLTCINITEALGHLTLGKQYECLDESAEYYTIRDDSGFKGDWFRYRFEAEPEWKTEEELQVEKDLEFLKDL
jgi:hypothetical protein